MTTILSIGLGLMTVAVIAELIAFRRLRKQIEAVDEDSRHVAETAIKYILKELDRNVSLFHEAKVEERFVPIPHFAVYRKGLTEKHDIIRVGYDPRDPDDRDYKRIHAEEVAEKLNEKP